MCSVLRQNCVRDVCTRGCGRTTAYRQDAANIAGRGEHSPWPGQHRSAHATLLSPRLAPRGARAGVHGGCAPHALRAASAQQQPPRPHPRAAPRASPAQPRAPSPAPTAPLLSPALGATRRTHLSTRPPRSCSRLGGSGSKCLNHRTPTVTTRQVPTSKHETRKKKQPQR